MSCAYFFQRFIFFAVIFLFISLRIFPQENEIDKLLRLNIEELANLKIISATKTLSKINEAPATVKVITAQTIKENGFLTLEDALSILPGFQFRNILGFNSYVFQRGIPNQNNLALLLVDGIQINELNSGGFYAGGQFNLDNVERIEIVYGPASALYGTNAISGIINIITKNIINNTGLSITGLFGSFNTYNGSFAYGYYDEKEEFGFRAVGMIKSSQKADLAGSEGDFNWTPTMENFEDDYSIDLRSQFHNLKFGFNFQNKQSSRTTNYKSTGTNYLDKNTLWNIGFINTYLKYNYSFTSNLDLLTTLYYRNSTIHNNTVAYIVDTSQVGNYRPNSLAGIENMLCYSPLPELKLIGGILFEYESLSDDFSVTYSNSSSEKPPAPKTPPMDNNTLLSIYLQAQYKLNELFNLYGGIRSDHSSIYNNIITPRMGLVFNENELTVKLLYSEAFRAPKPWDYTFGFGNPNLISEKMRSLEVAAQYLIFHNFNIDLSIYYNTLFDIIVQEETNNRSVNSGDVKTLGSEIALDYRMIFFKIFANYTYNSSIDNNGEIIPEIAKHTANLGITFYPRDNLDITLRGSYLGGRKNPKFINISGSDIINDAFIVYSSIAYAGFNNLRVSFTINNLFNQVYFHTSNRPPDRYRQPQRTMLFKIEYNL